VALTWASSLDLVTNASHVPSWAAAIATVLRSSALAFLANSSCLHAASRASSGVVVVWLVSVQACWRVNGREMLCSWYVPQVVQARSLVLLSGR
jgi:hypothetical protein